MNAILQPLDPYTAGGGSGLTAAASTDAGWRAVLRLGFEQRGGRTVLAQREHAGPLLVQRPFYPEGGLAHVYLLHPPGGVVGGDDLRVDVKVGPRAAALLTTPAATKFYRSAGPSAQQRIELRVAADAALEWLPQESLLFAGTRVRSCLRIELAAGARFIGWDICCLGRPAAGEGFDCGAATTRLQVWQETRPLLLERMQLDAAFLASAAGLRGHACPGWLLAYPCSDAHVALVRELHGDAVEPVGVTLLGELLVVRALAMQAEPLRRVFGVAWRRLRPAILARPALPPRIWAT